MLVDHKEVVRWCQKRSEDTQYYLKMGNKNLVYLIGTGFSKELFSTPTSQKFFNEEDFKDNESYRNLHKFISLYFNLSSVNLEEVAGLIEWKIDLNQSEHEFLKKTKWELDRYIDKKLLSSNKKNRDKRMLNFKILFEESQGVITTNYDLNIEKILGDPEFTESPFVRKLYNLLELKENINHFKDWNKILLKLHGSINWVGCNNTCSNNEIKRKIPQERVIEATYHEEEKCTCGEKLEKIFFSLAPSKRYEKFDKKIKEIWNIAHHLLKETKKIVIIGFSFADSDCYLRYLLKSAIAQNRNKKNLSIEVVDINPRVCKKIESITGLMPSYIRNIDKYIEKLKTLKQK